MSFIENSFVCALTSTAPLWFIVRPALVVIVRAPVEVIVLPFNCKLSTSRLSILLLVSVMIAELAVSVPGAWSARSAKYLPPITNTEPSAGLPTYSLDPPFELVPEPPV